MLTAALILFAEQPATEPGAAPSYFPILMWLPILLAFYLLVLRPPQKQEKERRAQLSSLKKNDKIVNSGGIIGIVEAIKDKDDEVVLRGGLRITKSSISRVILDEPAKEDKGGA